jgi:signal transduction histidine kinase
MFPTLSFYDPIPLRRAGLWAAVGAVVAVFAAQEYLYERFGTSPTVVPVFVLTALYALPAVYAALELGFLASISLAAMATILASASMVGYLLAGDVTVTWADNVQIVIVDVVAVLVGHFAEISRHARRRAEEAGEAHRRAEARYRRLYRSSIVEVQEGERTRLAHEIHDGPVQMLVQLCRRIDLVRARLADSAVGETDRERLAGDQLAELRDMAADVVDDLRRISQGLWPQVLADFGPVRALRLLVEDFVERSGLEASFEVAGEVPQVSRAVALALYRIVQEALQNVERHSGATSVAVRLGFRAGGGKEGHPGCHLGEATVEVEDDGLGLPERADGAGSDPHDRPTMGIAGMRERAEAIGGSLTVCSPRPSPAPGRPGTLVRAVLPWR